MLTWVIGFPFTDVATDPLHYGYRPADLVANHALEPSLSRVEMRIDFINTAPGAPLPDLVVWLGLGGGAPGLELQAMHLNASGAGTLRAASGYPEGTSGRFSMINNGVFRAGEHGALADGFPAEVVDIKPTGKNLATSSDLSSAPAPTPTPTAPAARRSTWGRIKGLYR